MSNPPLYNNKPHYFLQRPYSPKNTVAQTHSTKNLSLTMSIGANQNLNTYTQFKTNPLLFS
jgi:hypothetical protein